MTEKTDLECLIQETSSLHGESESRQIAKANRSYCSTKGRNTDEWDLDEEMAKFELDEERDHYHDQDSLEDGIAAIAIKLKPKPSSESCFPQLVFKEQ